MRTKLRTKIKAFERKAARQRKAMARRAYLEHAPMVLIAHFVGELKADEPVWQGFKRALGYDVSGDPARDMLEAMKTGRPIIPPKPQPLRRLFERLDLKCPQSRKELDKAILKLTERLPQRLKNYLKAEADGAFDNERRQRAFHRQVVAVLEQRFAAELAEISDPCSILPGSLVDKAIELKRRSSRTARPKTP